MATYKVLWEVEVDAESVREAAMLARDIQLDAESTATVFLVVDAQGEAHHVDTYDDLPEAEGDIGAFLHAMPVRDTDALARIYAAFDEVDWLLDGPQDYDTAADYDVAHGNVPPTLPDDGTWMPW